MGIDPQQGIPAVRRKLILSALFLSHATFAGPAPWLNFFARDPDADTLI